MKKGSITEEQVDGIISAANNDLKHTGGVARAICKAAGGQPFQKECSESMHRHLWASPEWRCSSHCSSSCGACEDDYLRSCSQMAQKRTGTEALHCFAPAVVFL